MKKANKVNVTRLVRIEGKGLRFCPVAYGKNHKIKPNAVVISGQETQVPEGRFYIDFLQDGKRCRRAAGETAAEAQNAADQQTALFNLHNAAAVTGHALPQAETGTRNLKLAVEAFLAEIKKQRKKKTHSAHKTALTYFLESCHKQNLEDVRRTDLLAFKTYLRDEKDQADRSVWNKFATVMSFLKKHKIAGLIEKGDWPKYVEEEVSVYTQEELTAFFAACTPTENLWFTFFLKTGCREQEVMNADWSWVDFERSVITVRENKRTGWKPKAYKGRVIPLPSSLLASLKAWKDKSDSTCGLIFPTAGCRPKQNFLDECKAIAERAGLNPQDFYLHKFRATRATELLQKGTDIKSVQMVLGHSDMESTMRYLGAQRVEILQKQIEAMEGV